MKICVFVEHINGEIKNSSLELLSLATTAASELTTFAFGAGSANLALSAWGVKKHFAASEMTVPHPEQLLDVADKVYQSEKPEILLASSNTLTKDFLARLTVRCDGAFMSDITEIKLSPLHVRRPLYAGKATAAVSFADTTVKILLIRPNQLEIKNPGKTQATEVVSITAGKTISQFQSQEKSANTTLDLTEANVIISGGRGLKSVDHFKLLHDMAAPLHATVGASRAVVDEWNLPHSMQVGQTGKTVAPSLYIAAGISGAIQHLAGMASSKVIVAINTDDKAPIFQKATYGLVGDVLAIAPALTEEFKKLKQ